MPDRLQMQPLPDWSVGTKSLLLAAMFSAVAAAVGEAQLPDLPLDRQPLVLSRSKDQPRVSARLAPPQAPPGQTVTLAVTIDLPADAYTYSMNPSFVGRTRIELKEVRGLEPLEGDWTADREPTVVHDAQFEKIVEKYTGTVTWFRRFRVVEGATEGGYRVDGAVDFKMCDSESCTPVVQTFAAVPGAAAATTAAAPTPERHPYRLQVRPTRKLGDSERSDPLELIFRLQPETAQPGETVTLSITARMDEGWHTYSLTNANISRPTRITLDTVTGLDFVTDGFQADVPFKVEDKLNEGRPQEVHEGQVTWTRQFTLQPGSAGAFGVRGEISYQVCNDVNCLPPKTVAFALGMVGENTAGGSAVPPPLDARPPSWLTPVEGISPPQAGSLPKFLLYAFLGGMILNVMPCVLPVLAIKVMSFVQQAGESRARIFALNLTYAVGVVSVFLALASLAIFPQILGQAMGWGGLFQRIEFNLIMACIVFAMGLSLLGVFEIPVPGLAGSGQHREGLLGAFFTGVLATLLATPCSGPFLGVTLAWSVKQPPNVTYLVWGTMGLGMAFPYLVFGLFPAAVRLLPKPGMWMVRLKEFAGFVLMGTVIFIIHILQQEYVVPLLIMLLGIGLGLWMIGNLYDPTTPVRHKNLVRVSALLLAGGICWIGYRFNDEGTHLPWEEFTEARLQQSLAENKTVLVDFSADWCATCKVIERNVLNTDETLAFVNQHNVVPLYADWTNRSPEITRWLERFDSISVPLTVIFPAGQPDRPIILRDVYTQSMLLESLQQAVAAAPKTGRQASLGAAARE